MSFGGVLLVALLMAVGLAGVLVPVIPGLPLVWLGGLIWALAEDGGGRWVVLAAMTGLLVVGAFAKYALPGRNLRAAGAPWTTLLVGVLGAVVGFFVIPVIGLFVGGVLGVLLAEQNRLGNWDRAWRSTRIVLISVGIGVLIELAAGLAMVLTWVLGLAVT